MLASRSSRLECRPLSLGRRQGMAKSLLSGTTQRPVRSACAYRTRGREIATILAGEEQGSAGEDGEDGEDDWYYV